MKKLYTVAPVVIGFREVSYIQQFASQPQVEHIEKLMTTSFTVE